MSAPGQKREHIKTQSTVQQSGDYDSIQISGPNSLKLRIPESFLSKEENFHLHGLRPGVYFGRLPPHCNIQTGTVMESNKERLGNGVGRLAVMGFRAGIMFYVWIVKLLPA
ncbi:hypothetical protein CDAR_255981 [Caerostris darwini]|uniref:Uncharacterized protein n=1 Tax=Caerostris darwini TaxID=1538125 RepID=A0AAV4NB92_9ARAC|nr:hypothetical protein CDAR_255981 [Caerostris darwini]